MGLEAAKLLALPDVIAFKQKEFSCSVDSSYLFSGRVEHGIVNNRLLK